MSLVVEVGMWECNWECDVLVEEYCLVIKIKVVRKLVSIVVLVFGIYLLFGGWCRGKVKIGRSEEESGLCWIF